MIKKQTVFILGAGASQPYGFPTGAELREEIIANFVSDTEHYFQARTDRAFPLATWKGRATDFVQKFDRSATHSIDLFLARNPEFAEIGKCAIVLRILKAEHNSRFRENVENRERDWYFYLLRRITDELTTKEDFVRFSENKLSVITFNYDRSLEHFLHEGLSNSFNQIAAGQVEEQLNSLRIIHVFGQVGGLDWQDMPSRIQYRHDPYLVDVGSLAKELRTMYEEQTHPELSEARRLINEARNVFFLGFGYAKENLDLLNIPGILKQKQQIRGTALGLTKKEITDIVSSITKRSGNMFLNCDIDIYGGWDSLHLLRQYL